MSVSTGHCVKDVLAPGVTYRCYILYVRRSTSANSQCLQQCTSRYSLEDKAFGAPRVVRKAETHKLIIRFDIFPNGNGGKSVSNNLKNLS